MVSFFSSDPAEFVRVGNDPNRLNLPMLHIQDQDREGFFARTDDQGRLTVDFPEFGAGGRRPKVFCSQEEANDADPSNNLAPGRSFDFASAIGPEGDLFGQDPRVAQRGEGRKQQATKRDKVGSSRWEEYFKRKMSEKSE